MMKFIYWAIGVREQEQKNSLNPNSMSPIPQNRFVNYARELVEKDEDKEPHKTIYGFKKWERSQKQRKQQADYNKWYDYFNH